MPRLPLPRALFLRRSTHIRYASDFASRPAPPKLPASEQAEFERLQREAAVSSAFQPSADQENASSSTQPAAEGEETDVNPALFRGAKPEFQGDVNPKTGEVGGPKNEPLR